MKIKNSQDCEKFLKRFDVEKTSFIFRDSQLSMVNGGATHITKKGDDFYSFSSGQNWSDQQSEIISNPVSFVWKHRKDIVSGMFL